MKEVRLEELETIGVRCKDEMETTITYMRDSDRAKIYTSDNVTMTRIKRAASKNPDAWRFYEMGRFNGVVTGYTAECPKKAISIVSGKKVELSDETKKRLADHLRKC